MKASLLVLATLSCLVFSASCDRRSTTTPPEAGESESELVPNLEAQPGDTTTCPYSGRPFVVKAEHPKVEYDGAHYWVCSEDAAEKIRADPDAYFEDFDG
jgi:YHS domain-containing protein